ncbi:hypothetical protein EMIHUDRAFT_125542, partial [Emiliania huxleyi CCMP1516]|uniref:Helicase ATP-binding domain-containing protein n=2 Tax=Emiliania huxleyi TaxID=2903 RepID=A0A0D3KXG9_EMIH1
AADAAGQERERELAEYRRLLQDPGPDVLVIDEAHVIKNEKNQLRAVLAGVRTMRRVLLTGTPLQNNLREYFHMVDYASPGELGDLDTFKRLYESTITDGQFRYGEDDDESRSQRAKTRREAKKRRKDMSKRIWALTRKLDKLVQRRGVEVLQRDLPRSQQYVMVLRPTPTQRALYNAKVESMAGRQQLFEFMTDMLRIYNHPAALLDPKTLAPNAKLVAKAAAAASIDAAAAAAAAGAAAGGAPSPHFPPAAPAGGPEGWG